MPLPVNKEIVTIFILLDANPINNSTKNQIFKKDILNFKAHLLFDCAPLPLKMAFGFRS
jgi:hypothetical protein